ncbi:DegT/DnrJ/EryC1/StrS aminotransferase family protein [Ruminococcus sp. M6(2020)]|uniref:DegT/DnrJ/EryC1/StrS aminotransferase family protein n=2 Tax=Ruminococcus difficilis TaxID=2763069 RepID=A0A935C3Q9_9FIRM|nr:DegT/DnrJ/EryC1/StrS aminotransferase family protein [Ruminococcus difficilis]MBK6089147.1 DegT/DnrJ/EryC1/StrS aminotransferase family protein [Ruminococcus difficilis]
MNIPFSPPDIGEDEIAEVVDTLRSGWITTGPKTKLFEQEIAKKCNTKKAVCLSSQTACAEMTLRLLGVGPGDEVIVPTYTYTASASIIYHVGATPVMIDCKQDSYEMDYDKVEEAITPKTKVIIPVDLAGVVCDYDRIFEIVEKKRSLFRASENPIQLALGRVIVMADAAHAFGAQWHGKMCGSIADFTNFSFHAVKNMTTAEGGAATWREIPGVDSNDLYKQYMLMTLHGQTKDAFTKDKGTSWEYDVVNTQYKCNMPDVLAAIGLAQLRRYDRMLSRRHQLIARYNKAFEGLNIQVLDHRGSDHRSSGHLYFVRFLGKDAEFRNRFYDEMKQRGVNCNVHFKPLPMMTAYKQKGFDIIDYPYAYNMHKNQLTLPMNSVMTDEEAQYVIDTFIEVYNKLT